ncbi:MAG: glycosyltransferase family 2 protein [Desulfomonile tiedjei]|nr:glycosyltransferase family 2 protein [Desulfomonile tiedjei]
MSDSLPNTLSVIIVNRNTADLLVRCLDHVFRSDLSGKPEVIVVDNGSTDGSVARAKAAFPEVTIIEAGRNLGFAAANNRAFEKASGDFLLLVNTDALLEKDCARKLLDLMNADPGVGMVGPQLLNEDGTVQTSYEAVPTLATETLNRSLLKRLFPSRFPSKSCRLEGPEQVEALIGAVMMIRRKALEQVGAFDEDYFFFLEETDLAVRMRHAGWRVVHEPRARAIHLQGATAKAVHEAARIEFYRSRYLFFQKHYGNGARNILSAVLTLNLTLNVLVLGAATFVTLGRVHSLGESLRVRAALWKWHLQGCPPGPGLPRN